MPADPSSPRPDKTTPKRRYRHVEKACAAGPGCPFCGGTFTGMKAAKWCRPEARRWKLRQDRHNGHRAPDLVPRWRCPVCGQLAFGDDAPFVCEFCGDAVTWERWP